MQTLHMFLGMVRELCEGAGEQLMLAGELPPTTLVFPRIGKVIQVPTPPVDFKSDEAKDMHVLMTRWVAKSTDAIAVIMLLEIWIRGEPFKPGESREDAQKRAQAAGRVSEHPDAKEAIFIVLEHEELPHQATWVGHYERDAARKVKTAPVFEQLSDGHNPTFEGRFANLLPRRG